MHRLSFVPLLVGCLLLTPDQVRGKTGIIVLASPVRLHSDGTAEMTCTVCLEEPGAMRALELRAPPEMGLNTFALDNTRGDEPTILLRKELKDGTGHVLAMLLPKRRASPAGDRRTLGSFRLEMPWNSVESALTARSVTTAGERLNLPVHFRTGEPGMGDRRNPIEVAVMPNPSPGPVTFRARMASPSPIELDVFDLAGRKVFTFRSAEIVSESWEYTWDARLEDQHPVASGIYFVSIRTQSGHQTRRLTIAR